MIYYFSGTGNSFRTARELSAALGEPLADMTAVVAEEVSDDKVGFVFPVYAWGLPCVVEQFLQRLANANANAPRYVYAVLTCGDDIGRTDVLLRKALRRVGWGLNAVFSLRMRNTYVCLPGFDTDTAEVERAKENEWRKRLGEVSQIIAREGCSTASDLIPGAMPGLKSYVLRPLFNRFLISPSRFRVDEKRCKHCGACAKVCPLHNISQENADRLPRWGNHCTHCLACYHVCSAHAVNYGNFTRHKGQVKVMNGRNEQ
ncbi:MAG: EFR1 family ferrodoxin [Alloprevotella sp.]